MAFSHTGPAAITPAVRTPASRRRIWFQVHLWLGWLTALPLLAVCLTGIVLSYEEEFYRLEQPEHYALQPSGTPMSLPDVLATLERAELHINHLEVPLDPRTAYLAFANGVAPDGTRRGLRAYVDPYQGTLTHEWENPTFIRKMEVWHRTLSAGTAGRWIVAVSSLLLAVISLAGLVLWWPMRRGTLRRFSTQRRALDWHNVTGLAALVPLIVLGVTGITFTWGRIVFPLLDEWTGTPSIATVPKLAPLPAGTPGERLPLAAVAQRVLVEHPGWQIRGVQGARPGSDLPYKFLMRRPDALLKNASLQIYIDPRTGEEIGRWDAAASGPVGAYRRSFYIFHTGHGFSPWLRTGWALSSAAGLLVIVTGCWLSLRRWKRTQGRDDKALSKTLNEARGQLAAGSGKNRYSNSDDAACTANPFTPDSSVTSAPAQRESQCGWSPARVRTEAGPPSGKNAPPPANLRPGVLLKRNRRD